MRRSVLILDDDPAAGPLLEHHLSAAYDVVLCSDGADARAIWERSRPDIVIADWDAPGLPGAELCRLVRAGAASGPPVFLVMTFTPADAGAVEAALDAGADDCLTKPFDRRELLARLRAGHRILDLQAQLAERVLELWRLRSALAEGSGTARARRSA